MFYRISENCIAGGAGHKERQTCTTEGKKFIQSSKIKVQHTVPFGAVSP